MPNPFNRPLTFGDAGQIAALRIMNGRDLYCPLCFREHDRICYSPGARCTRCHRGKLVRAANHPAEVRRRARTRGENAGVA